MLMVSGIGPPDILQQHNIPVVSPLPGVGQNMWDHLLFGQSYQVTPITHSALDNASYLALATEQYIANGSGLLGNPGGDILGWEKLPNPQRESLSNATRAALKTFPPDWPELEYLILDAYSGDNENYITGAPRTPFMYASPSAALVAPLSRGNVTISSADMEDPPIINPNWLTHPADQELALAGFKRVRQLMDTDVMKSVTVGSEVFPGRNVSSDAQILDAIRQNGIMTFHASVTCELLLVSQVISCLALGSKMLKTHTDDRQNGQAERSHGRGGFPWTCLWHTGTSGCRYFRISYPTSRAPTVHRL